MAKQRRVVVLVTPRVLTNSTTGQHAARILELGLTGYGWTHDEALRKVKRMYVSAVYAHRELGTLEAWLDGSGLEWSWYDEYKGVLPVEYVGVVDDNKPSGFIADSRAADRRQEHPELAVAA